MPNSYLEIVDGEEVIVAQEEAVTIVNVIEESTNLTVGEEVFTLAVDDGNAVEVITVGTQGPPGADGGGTAADWSYYHTQGGVSASWVITHNLGFRPNVTVFTSANQMVEGDVVHDSLNQLTITFSAGFSGYAVLS